MKIFERILRGRLWPLFIKELTQIRRNRRLMISLVIPPTVQLIVFGFALNPEVTNLRLGVVDENMSVASRNLVSDFVESRSFEVKQYYPSSDDMGRALGKGDTGCRSGDSS